jgi:hypothetical protein
LPAAEAQVSLDRGEITPAAPVTFCDGNQRSVFYRVINNTRDAVGITAQCDFSGADKMILKIGHRRHNPPTGITSSAILQSI